MTNYRKQLNDLLNSMDFNGVLLLAKGEDILFHREYGYADREISKRMKRDSVFELASLSKTFTATAIIKLAEEDLLSLDDLAAKWIDGFPYLDVTIKHLLNHTSGIPEYMELVMEHWEHSKMASNSDVLELLITHRPDEYFAPGDDWAYTNTNYVMLALIIEAVSGNSYATYLDEEIFQPLSMKHSYVHDGKTLLEHDVVSYAHDPESNTYERTTDSPEYAYVTNMAGIYGDGAVHSNAQDLLRFEQAFHTGELIGPNSIKQALIPAEPSLAGLIHYGWGWVIKHDEEKGLIIGHNGGWAGFSTCMYRYVDHGRTLIYLCNEAVEPIFEEQLLNAITNILLGIPYKIPDEAKHKVAIQIDMEDCKTFVGTYAVPGEPNMFAEILIEDGDLYLQFTGQVKVKLYSESKRVFFIKNIGIVLQFVLHEGNKAREIILEEEGETLILKRI